MGGRALQRLVAPFQRDPQLGRPARFPFVFHEGQEDYLAAVHPIVLNISSNRFGKTTVAVADAILRANGVHPYKDVPLADCIWSAFPSYNFYVRVTRRIFLNLIPRRLLLSWNEQSKHAVIRRVDGGVCDLFFVSYEQKVKDWAGANVDHAHLDELCPDSHFREVSARVAQKQGTIGITVTPVEGLGWMEDELFLPAKSGERRDVLVLEGGLAEYDDSCTCGHAEGGHKPQKGCQAITPEGVKCRCTTFRHRTELGVGRVKVPHFPREAVLQFARTIADPADRSVRVFGIYRRRTGGVYKDFDVRVHVVPAFPVAQHWTLWGCLDPGFHGWAACLLAMDPTGRVYVFAELFSSLQTTSTRIEALWALALEKLPFLADPEDESDLVVYTDTAAAQEVLELQEWAQALVWTDASGERRMGCKLVFVQLEQGKKAIDAGVRRVQDLLQPRPTRKTPIPVTRPMPEEGEPLLYLMDDLFSEWVVYAAGSGSDEGKPMSGSRLVWELKGYRWKKPSEREPHPKGPDDNSAGGAHMLDALRYGIMARLAAPDEKEKERDQETPSQRRARLDRERAAEMSQRNREARVG